LFGYNSHRIGKNISNQDCRMQNTVNRLERLIGILWAPQG
jgi:hypothetical protein